MEIIGKVSIFILFVLILVDICKGLFSKDRSVFWSPVTFVCVCIIYYILVPYISAHELLDPTTHGYIAFASLLYYVVFKISFDSTRPRYRFNVINNLIEKESASRAAFVLFLIATFMFLLFNDFSLTIFSSIDDDFYIFDESRAYNHPEQYLTNLISCFCLVAGLEYVSKSRTSIKLLIYLAFAVVIYIIGGFRYRLLLLFISFFTIYHLYPSPKNIRYIIVVPLFIVLYLFVGVLEHTRAYGHGINEELWEDVISGDLEHQSAIENTRVYTYSAEVIENSDSDDYIYFEPFVNALLMPIPRSLFPWKPKGIYTRETSMRILGNIAEGQAFCTIVEGYLSFGWFGIILYGFLLGWLAKLFWLNYLDNQEKIGAILLLALFNAMIYVIFSRGYLAQAFTQFMYYVFIPFWLVMLLKKIKVVK